MDKRLTASIAMTTYNGIKYIPELLDSIIGQDELPDEVVIVDDCSTDGTYEYIKEYIQNYRLNNWFIYCNDKNIGWKANFREAIKKCTSDLVFLCDQDDIWFPYKIKEMKAVMDGNNSIQLLASNYEVKYEDRKEKIKVSGLENNDSSVNKIEFMRSSLSVMRPGCTFCFRKDLFRLLNEDDIITLPHDAILWGYAAINDSLYMYNRTTILYRRYSESASTPKKKLCRTRRIEEVASYNEYGGFFLRQCRKKGDEQKAGLIEEQMRFNKKREELLSQKSLWGMFVFQLKNHHYYTTLRNMLSDDYVLIFNKD